MRVSRSPTNGRRQPKHGVPGEWIETAQSQKDRGGFLGGFKCGKYDKDDQAKRKRRNACGMEMSPLSVMPNFVSTFGIMHIRISRDPLPNIILEHIFIDPNHNTHSQAKQ